MTIFFLVLIFAAFLIAAVIENSPKKSKIMECCNKCDKAKACIGYDSVANLPFVEVSYDSLKLNASHDLFDEFSVLTTGPGATHSIVATLADNDGLKTLKLSLVPIPVTVTVES